MVCVPHERFTRRTVINYYQYTERQNTERIDRGPPAACFCDTISVFRWKMCLCRHGCGNGCGCFAKLHGNAFQIISPLTQTIVLLAHSLRKLHLCLFVINCLKHALPLNCCKSVWITSAFVKLAFEGFSLLLGQRLLTGV